MTDSEKAQGMLAIVREVHDSAKSIMGPSWTVYDEMATIARAGEVDEMVRYFLAYKRSARAIQLRQRLQMFGKKTLESRERRFMAIARST